MSKQVSSSKNNFIYIFYLLLIEICKTSSKNDLSPNTKKFPNQKLKENSSNNIKFTNTFINNNMKCINVDEIDTEYNDKKLSVESLGDKEYELCLKNALKEALDENEKVRKIFLIKIYIDERTNY